MRLIATRLRAGIALLSAGVIGTALALFAGCTEEAGQAPEPPAATRSSTHAEKAGLPSEVNAIDGRSGSDCGFGTFARTNYQVEPEIVWAKFRAMAEGAGLASEQLWG